MSEKHELWHLLEKDDFQSRLIGHLVIAASTHPSYSAMHPQEVFDHFAAQANRNPSEVAAARSVLIRALSDPTPGELRSVYTANIAMKIYDNQRSPKPLRLTDATDCNEMAEILLKLLFDADPVE